MKSKSLIYKYQTGNKLDTTGYAQRALDMRPVPRYNDPEGKSTSTHVMAAETMDGKTWYGFPTIFPKDPKNPTNDPNDWLDLGEDREAAFAEAKKRGELFEFGTDAKAALAFGEGSWKPKYKKGGLLYKKKALTKEQKEMLKEHSVHHSPAHMDEMIKAMEGGATFEESHKLAMKKKGK